MSAPASDNLAAIRVSFDTHGDPLTWGSTVSFINSAHGLWTYGWAMGTPPTSAQPAVRSFQVREISYTNPVELVILVPVAIAYAIFRLVRRASRLRVELAEDDADVAKAKAQKRYWDGIARMIEQDLEQSAPAERIKSVGIAEAADAVVSLTVTPADNAADQLARRVDDTEK